MYRIEKAGYGVKLTFGGFIQPDEMAKWYTESETTARTLPSRFGVFVDMRDLKPLPAESQTKMQAGQKLFKAKGMERSVVVLNNPTTTFQFKRIANETGIAQWERYIDASTNADWEEKGRQWLVSAKDPGK